MAHMRIEWHGGALIVGLRMTTLRNGSILVLIVVALVITAWPMLSKPNSPDFIGPGDAWRTFGPYAFYMDHAIHSGEFPMWNPLSFCGRPFVADPTATPFYPPHLLRSVLTFSPTPFKTHAGMMVVMLLHALMAGIATFALCRDHRLSRGAALVGVFCFLLGAPFVFALHRHYFYVLIASWCPVTILFLKKAMDANTTRSKFIFTVLLGLSFGAAMLAGSVLQPILYTGIVLAEFGLCYRLIKMRNPDDFRPPHIKSFASDGAIAAGALLVAGLTAAAGLLPTMELASFSERGRSAQSAFTTDGGTWEYSLGEVARILVSYSTDERFQYLGMAGTVAFVLVLASIAYCKFGVIVPYLVPAYTLFDCSLGRPMPFATLLEAIAPYRLGPPERAMLIGAFPLAMLAAFGADAIFKRMGNERGDRIRTGALGLAGIAAIAIAAVQLRTYDYLDVPHWVLLVPLVALAIACGLRRTPYAAWMVAALVMVESVVWSSRFLPHHLNDHQRIASVADWDKTKQFWDTNRRSFDGRPNVAMYDLRGTVDGYTPLHDSRLYLALCAPRNESVYQRELVREVYTDNLRTNLFLKRPFWLVRNYVQGSLPPKDALFPPTTTVYLPEATNMDMAPTPVSAVPPHGVSDAAESVRLIRKFQFDRMSVHTQESGNQSSSHYHHFPVTFEKPPQHSVLALSVRSKGALRIDIPISRMVDGAKQDQQYLYSYVLSGDALHMTTLEYPLPDFDAFQIGFNVVPQSDDWAIEFLYADLLTDPWDEDDHMTIDVRTANRVDLTVHDLPSPRWLLNSDAYYPGWYAYIDGARTPIMRANDVFKAIQVPAGTHRVQFVFRPWRVFVGVSISCVTVLVSLCLIAFAIRYARTKQVQHNPRSHA